MLDGTLLVGYGCFFRFGAPAQHKRPSLLKFDSQSSSSPYNSILVDNTAVCSPNGATWTQELATASSPEYYEACASNITEASTKELLFVREETERRLIERAQRYDESALSELYRRHADDIFRYIFYRVGDKKAAEDLVGDVFINMLEGLPSYEYTGAPFEAWLYRIAHARVVDYYRRQEVRDTAPLEDRMPAGERTNPDSLAGMRDDFRRAWKAMKNLTDDQQHVLALRFFAGYSIAETASVLDKTEGAVKGLQYRAIASLRRLMGVE